jgi:hypothetical protein
LTFRPRGRPCASALFGARVSGLSDEALGELAAINYVIDARGKTAIEDQAGVRSALGRSPDIAEALMVAMGEPRYEPFRHTPLRTTWRARRSTRAGLRAATRGELALNRTRSTTRPAMRRASWPTAHG